MSRSENTRVQRDQTDRQKMRIFFSFLASLHMLARSLGQMSENWATLPRVLSSMMSLTLGFSAVLLRGFLAGGGV